MATSTKELKKATKKVKGKIHMALLLDESGSMGHLVREVVDGSNEFVNAMRGEENADRVRVTVGMFDSTAPVIRYPVLSKKLAEVSALTDEDYRPNALTPLNDAIIETIEKVGESMKKKDKALLVIYTDGYENASRASAATVKALVTDKEKEGWTFIFLGADLDAQAAGAAVGITNTSKTVGTSKGTRNSVAMASNMGAAYLSEDGVLPDYLKGSKTITEDGEIEDGEK